MTPRGQASTSVPVGDVKLRLPPWPIASAAAPGRSVPTWQRCEYLLASPKCLLSHLPDGRGDPGRRFARGIGDTSCPVDVPHRKSSSGRLTGMLPAPRPWLTWAVAAWGSGCGTPTGTRPTTSSSKLPRAPPCHTSTGVPCLSVARWGYRWGGSLLASGWSTTGDRPAGSTPENAVRLGEQSMSSQGARDARPSRSHRLSIGDGGHRCRRTRCGQSHRR